MLKKIFLPMAFVLSLVACSSKSEDERLMLKLLEDQASDPTRHYFVISELVRKQIIEKRFHDALITLQEALHNSSPQDTYRGLYYFLIARIHEEAQKIPLAVEYYRFALQNFEDILIDGESFHERILLRLTTLERNPYLRRDFFRALLTRSNTNADSSMQNWWKYSLAKVFESIQDWKQAMTLYEELQQESNLHFPAEALRLEPNIDKIIEDKVVFHSSSKDWLEKDLNLLIERTKNAIWNADMNRLNRLRNRVSFFIRAWEGNDNDYLQDEIDLAGFLNEFVRQASHSYSGRIRFADSFDSLSSRDIVYLASSGWARISTWYFVFQKVDYPLDPEIHKSWEWIGIYLGTKT